MAQMGAETEQESRWARYRAVPTFQYLCDLRNLRGGISCSADRFSVANER